MLNEGGRRLNVAAREPVSCGRVRQHCSEELDSLKTTRFSSPLQHGMVSMHAISMPAVSQTCSFWSRAVPASTLPPNISTKIRDENRFSIANRLSTKQIAKERYLAKP